MKPHIIIRLRPGGAAPRRPHWLNVISQKADTEVLSQEISGAFSRHDVKVWTTAEYAPAGESWSVQERDAGLNRVYRLILSREQRIPSGLIADIQLIPTVAEVRVGRISAAPLTSQPMSRRVSDAARTIRLQDAHRLSRGQEDVTIAILDTGIDTDHAEFEGRIRSEADFVNILDGAQDFIGDVIDADADADDEVGHGTHVAGIVAARGAGMNVGVAPECTLMPVRVLATMRRNGERLGAGLIENINAGVKYAVDNGADVINMSLGIRHESGGLPHEEVVNYARSKGVLIVAASGNDGTDTKYYPGAFESVVTVGALAFDATVAPFSTYGHQVKLVAPGENIISAQPGGGYGAASGTSQAAPFVAGVAALVQSVARRSGGRFSDRNITEILTTSADPIGTRYRDKRAGFGRLNAADAVNLAQARIN